MMMMIIIIIIIIVVVVIVVFSQITLCFVCHVSVYLTTDICYCFVSNTAPLAAGNLRKQVSFYETSHNF